MSLINHRQPVLKKCYTPDCEILTLTSSSRKRCEVCLERLASTPKRPYKTRQGQDDWESPSGLARAEQAYQAALQEIKARPRPEPDLRWYSPLHGLKGTGL